MKKLIKKFLIKMGVFRQIKYSYLYINCLYIKLIYNVVVKKEKYIKRKFKRKLGYEIDFSKDPVTFNQKIQFRKLYDNNPLYAICADKYRVREYVKKKIGEEYLIPLYLVTDKLTMEQWEELPESFVAKANHNSGPVQIVKDKSKVDAKKIIKELNNQLKIDYGVLSMEKYYSDIPRKIIVEKYLKDNIEDYKFHVFHRNGEYHIFLQIDEDRFKGHKRSFYDENLNKLNMKFVSSYPLGSIVINQVLNKKIYEKMKIIVKKLAEGFEYVRVDLYNANGKIYFGELTFCAESGFGDFSPIEWDYKFGSFWDQSKLK